MKGIKPRYEYNVLGIAFLEATEERILTREILAKRLGISISTLSGKDSSYFRSMPSTRGKFDPEKTRAVFEGILNGDFKGNMNLLIKWQALHVEKKQEKKLFFDQALSFRVQEFGEYGRIFPVRDRSLTIDELFFLIGKDDPSKIEVLADLLNKQAALGALGGDFWRWFEMNLELIVRILGRKFSGVAELTDIQLNHPGMSNDLQDCLNKKIRGIHHRPLVNVLFEGVKISDLKEKNLVDTIRIMTPGIVKIVNRLKPGSGATVEWILGFMVKSYDFCNKEFVGSFPKPQNST